MIALDLSALLIVLLAGAVRAVLDLLVPALADDRTGWTWTAQLVVLMVLSLAARRIGIPSRMMGAPLWAWALLLLGEQAFRAYGWWPFGVGALLLIAGNALVNRLAAARDDEDVAEAPARLAEALAGFEDLRARLAHAFLVPAVRPLSPEVVSHNREILAAARQRLRLSSQELARLEAYENQIASGRVGANEARYGGLQVREILEGTACLREVTVPRGFVDRRVESVVAAQRTLLLTTVVGNALFMLGLSWSLTSFEGTILRGIAGGLAILAATGSLALAAGLAFRLSRIVGFGVPPLSALFTLVPAVGVGSVLSLITRVAEWLQQHGVPVQGFYPSSWDLAVYRALCGLPAEADRPDPFPFRAQRAIALVAMSAGLCWGADRLAPWLLGESRITPPAGYRQDMPVLQRDAEFRYDLRDGRECPPCLLVIQLVDGNGRMIAPHDPAELTIWHAGPDGSTLAGRVLQAGPVNNFRTCLPKDGKVSLVVRHSRLQDWAGVAGLVRPPGAPEVADIPSALPEGCDTEAVLREVYPDGSTTVMIDVVLETPAVAAD